MQFSDCLAVNPDGLLIYLGHKGKLYEVLGGDKNGHLKTRSLN